MADTEQPKTRGLTCIAARASCAIFLLAVAFFIIGIPALPVATLRFGSLFLSFVGLFLGGIALLGAITARTRDIFVGFAGMALNALLLFGVLTCTFDRPYCSSPRACIANLKQMEGAKVVWALEYHKSTNDTPGLTDLVGTNAYLRYNPFCPEGGIYRIGTVAQKTTCSVPGHTL